MEDEAVFVADAVGEDEVGEVFHYSCCGSVHKV